MKVIHRRQGQQFKIAGEIIGTVICTSWEEATLIIRCSPKRSLFFDCGDGGTPLKIKTYKPFKIPKGESVWIDDDIAIYMCLTSPSFLAIGVDGPRDINLVVEEAYYENHPQHRRYASN